MKLMKNQQYLEQKFSREVLVPQTTADFTSRVSKSYVPFTCKIPYGKLNAFCADSSQALQVKNQFLCFWLCQNSLEFCASFRFFLAVFMGKFPKIRYLSYVRRGIDDISKYIMVLLSCRHVSKYVRPKSWLIDVVADPMAVSDFHQAYTCQTFRFAV